MYSFLLNIIFRVDILLFIIMLGKVILEIFVKVAIDKLMNIILCDVRNPEF